MGWIDVQSHWPLRPRVRRLRTQNTTSSTTSTTRQTATIAHTTMTGSCHGAGPTSPGKAVDPLMGTVAMSHWCITSPTSCTSKRSVAPSSGSRSPFNRNSPKHPDIPVWNQIFKKTVSDLSTHILLSWITFQFIWTSFSDLQLPSDVNIIYVINKTV